MLSYQISYNRKVSKEGLKLMLCSPKSAMSNTQNITLSFSGICVRYTSKYGAISSLKSSSAESELWCLL